MTPLAELGGVCRSHHDVTQSDCSSRSVGCRGTLEARVGRGATALSVSLVIVLASLALPSVARAGQPAGQAPVLDGATSGPDTAPGVAPPPVPPATISRTPDGAVTVRAVRIAEPLILDGRLDERVYQDVPSLDNFIQSEPREGELASEPTDAWIFFDDRNIYVAARCWDSQPERMVANEMRRDASTILRNENFSFIFDTF